MMRTASSSSRRRTAARSGPDLLGVGLRVEDVARLAAGARDQHGPDALGPVPGHGGRTLGRLVVGVGVHREHPQRGRGRGIHGAPRYRRSRSGPCPSGRGYLRSRLTRQAVAIYTSWSVTPPPTFPTGATMATKTSDPTAVFTDAVLAGVKQSQELAFSGISLWIDFAGKAFTMPELDSLPFVGPAPQPEGRRRVQLRLRRGAARHAEGLRDQGRRRRHAARRRRPDRPTVRTRPGSPHRAGTQSFPPPRPLPSLARGDPFADDERRRATTSSTRSVPSSGRSGSWPTSRSARWPTSPTSPTRT